MNLAASDDASMSHYRSVSWTAILALALALTSALAVGNPLFLALPLAALAASLYALRQIAANSELLTGRSLAIAALFLSIFFLVFAPARLWMRSRVVQQKGQELAEAFLALLQEERLAEAHQLAQIKYITPRPDESMTPGFDPKKLTPEDSREFEKTQTIRNMQRLDFKFTYHLEGVESGRAYKDAELLVLRYRIVPDSGDEKKSFPVWISVARTVEPSTGMATWKIVEMQHFLKKQ